MSNNKEKDAFNEVFCKDHSAMMIRINRNEEDIKRNQKAINTIKTWVIAGSCSVILQLGIALIKLLS